MPFANSGLPVFEGCVPAWNLRKSALSACSAGLDPVALVTTRGASIPAITRPSAYGATVASMASSVVTAERCNSRQDSSSTAIPVGFFSPQARSMPR